MRNMIYPATATAPPMGCVSVDRTGVSLLFCLIKKTLLFYKILSYNQVF